MVLSSVAVVLLSAAAATTTTMNHNMMLHDRLLENYPLNELWCSAPDDFISLVLSTHTPKKLRMNTNQGKFECWSVTAKDTEWIAANYYFDTYNFPQSTKQVQEPFRVYWVDHATYKIWDLGVYRWSCACLPYKTVQ